MTANKKNVTVPQTGKPDGEKHPPKRNFVNTDLSTWDEQFKDSIRKGKKPETDLWSGLQNEFYEKEW